MSDLRNAAREKAHEIIEKQDLCCWPDAGYHTKRCDQMEQAILTEMAMALDEFRNGVELAEKIEIEKLKTAKGIDADEGRGQIACLRETWQHIENLKRELLSTSTTESQGAERRL